MTPLEFNDRLIDLRLDLLDLIREADPTYPETDNAESFLIYVDQQLVSLIIGLTLMETV